MHQTTYDWQTSEARNLDSFGVAKGGIVMKILRRQFLQFAGAVAAAGLPQFASALDYPSRPVRIVVGFSAGGTQDPIARLMGQWLSERLGQPFIIENWPSAGGNIGADAGARAAPAGLQ